MAIDERARHELHEAARRAFGTDAGDTLMTLLPPVGWGDVATKADLDALRVATKQDLHVLATELRSEMSQLASELRSEIAGLRTEMADGQRRLTIQLVMVIVTLNGVLTGLVAALA